MREFKKSSKLDNVLYDVRGPVVEEADRMIARGIEVLKLNIGNPAPFGFRAPEEVITDMAENLRDSEGYSNSKGTWPARKAIMQYAQDLNIPNVSMEDIYTGTEKEINASYSIFAPYFGGYYQIAPNWPVQRTAWWNLLQRIFATGNIAEEVAVYLSEVQ